MRLVSEGIQDVDCLTTIIFVTLIEYVDADVAGRIQAPPRYRSCPTARKRSWKGSPLEVFFRKSCPQRSFDAQQHWFSQWKDAIQVRRCH